MQRGNGGTRMDDQSRDHTDKKGPPQNKRPKQKQTHDVPTDDVDHHKLERRFPTP